MNRRKFFASLLCAPLSAAPIATDGQPKRGVCLPVQSGLLRITKSLSKSGGVHHLAIIVSDVDRQASAIFQFEDAGLSECRESYRQISYVHATTNLFESAPLNPTHVEGDWRHLTGRQYQFSRAFEFFRVHSNGPYVEYVRGPLSDSHVATVLRAEVEKCGLVMTANSITAEGAI